MNRKACDRPLLFSLVSMLLAIPVMHLFIIPIARLVPFYFGETVKFLGSFLVVMGICQDSFGKPPFPVENKGFFRGLFTAGAAGLVLACLALVCSFSTPEQLPGISVLLGFLLCCAATAVSEEFLFRGLILSVLERKYTLRRAVFLSALFFGVRCLFNLVLAPGTPVSTLGQAVFTFFAGVYLAALYRKTGNLWICIAIHFLENCFTGLWPLFSAAPVQDGKPLPTLLLAAVHVVYVLAALPLLKSAPPREDFYPSEA